MVESQNVLVTGVAGHLGSHLAPLLVDEGFAVRGIDIIAPQDVSGAEVRQADLLDPEQCDAMVEGIDIVVHCASIHPWKPYTDAQYFDSNVKGAWNLYAAMARHGIGRIVLTSSIAAVGYGGEAAWPVGEDAQFVLGDLYSLTKHAQEDIARMYAAGSGVQTLALRPPAFMPKDAIETAFMLTGAFAVVEDIADAHLAAVLVLAGRRGPGQPVGMFEPIWTTNKLPYTMDDQALQSAEGLPALVRKHWPEEYAWLCAQGYEGAWLPTVYDLTKAAALLGWAPKIGLAEWAEKVRG